MQTPPGYIQYSLSLSGRMRLFSPERSLRFAPVQLKIFMPLSTRPKTLIHHSRDNLVCVQRNLHNRLVKLTSSRYIPQQQ